MEHLLDIGERDRMSDSLSAQPAPTEEGTNYPEIPKVDLLDRVLFVPCCIVFLTVLVLAEIAERIAFLIGGSKGIKKWVTPYQSAGLIFALRFSGVRVRFLNTPKFVMGRPGIIVVNHQSMIDIPIIGKLFAPIIPQYVSKVELARGIPGVSYSLRNSGDILIDRGNSSQALKEIVRFGRRINEDNTSAVIFPEGTRARDGVLKAFKPAGLAALIRSAPRAVVYPVTVDGSWKISYFKRGPLPRGTVIDVVAGDPIEPSLYGSPDEVIAQVYQSVSSNLGKIRSGDEVFKPQT